MWVASIQFFHLGIIASREWWNYHKYTTSSVKLQQCDDLKEKRRSTRCIFYFAMTMVNDINQLSWIGCWGWMMWWDLSLCLHFTSWIKCYSSPAKDVSSPFWGFTKVFWRWWSGSDWWMLECAATKALIDVKRVTCKSLVGKAMHMFYKRMSFHFFTTSR